MRIFITLLASLSVFISFTQEVQKPGTAVSLELGGRNFLIGADVDFGITKTKKHRLSAGFGILGFGGGYGMYRYLVKKNTSWNLVPVRFFGLVVT